MTGGIVGYPAAARRTWDPDLTVEQGLALIGLGRAGESGEVVDHLKKYLFHAKPLDREKVLDELGDVLWYISNACDLLGTTLDEVADRNDAKLRRRYPNGFIPNAARLAVA